MLAEGISNCRQFTNNFIISSKMITGAFCGFIGYAVDSFLRFSVSIVSYAFVP